MAADNDEDAILVMQFEDSIAETIQADSELAAYYASYQDARRCLSERVKVRGFWPVHRKFDKGQGKKGKGKSKGKGFFAGSNSLSKRIANSYCRLCMQRGHWKNECPQRQSATSNQNASSASSHVPASFVIAEDLPTDFINLAVSETQDKCDVAGCFGTIHNWGNGKMGGIR